MGIGKDWLESKGAGEKNDEASLSWLMAGAICVGLWDVKKGKRRLCGDTVQLGFWKGKATRMFRLKESACVELPLLLKRR